jgi:hypothetical protein
VNKNTLSFRQRTLLYQEIEKVLKEKEKPISFKDYVDAARYFTTVLGFTVTRANVASFRDDLDMGPMLKSSAGTVGVRSLLAMIEKLDARVLRLELQAREAGLDV